MPCRIAVLASGGGSNLRAVYAHFAELGARRSGEVVLVASDRPRAGALLWARERGIATALLDTGPDHAGELASLLAAHGIELIVLAGYLRLVPAETVRTYRGRILNVHPALLPSFGGPGMYGARVHRAVLAAGARVSGPTVHFVDERFDSGAIVAQWPVPVYREDTEDSLAARVLRVEHLLLPGVVQAVAAGRISLGSQPNARGESRVSRGGTAPASDTAFVLAPTEDIVLGECIAASLEA